MRGNFDTIIRQQLARGKDDNLFKRLKKHEQSMEPHDVRPNVLMEPDKQEMDYPSTHEYNYTRDPNEAPRPRAKNQPEFIRRPKQRVYKR